MKFIGNKFALSCLLSFIRGGSMKKLTKMLPAICLLMQMSFAHALTQKTIQYENQREEIFDLENWLKEIQYKTEEVKDTCTKKVPYEEKVCKDVTKYKKECKTIPAHEECKDVNNPICHTETRTRHECHTPTRRECHTETKPVCHNETRYETECTNTPPRQECRTEYERVCRNEIRYENRCRTVPGEQQCRVVIRHHEECRDVPGGRQCRQIPPDIKCRIINGENKCEKIPAREECTDTSSRRECRQVPYEERECSTGPARQECHQVPRQEQVCENEPRQQCHTIPGSQQCSQVPRQEQVCENRSEQICQDVPGDQVCRNVPHQEQVCEDNINRVCENVPAKESCKNVPYKEQVCKMETKYKDEQYECTKKVQVPHEVTLKTHKARIQMNFNEKSTDARAEFKVALNTQGNLALTAKADDQLVFVKKQINNEEEADINSINAIYNIVMMDKSEYFKFMNTGIKNIELESKLLRFSVDGKIELKRASLAIKISKKEKIKLDKLILGSEMISEFNGEQTVITIDLKKIGAPTLGGIFRREHNIIMKLKLDYSDLGESILTYEKEFSTSINVNTKVQ